MRKAVTTDAGVLAGWPKSKKPIASAAVAKALGITVFQITARLKGMEQRGLLQRSKAGLWEPTGKEASPEPERRVSTRVHGKGLPAIGLPDDKKVPHIKPFQSSASTTVVANAVLRLQEVRKRIKEYEKDKGRYRRELMALRTEEENCVGILDRTKGAKTWKTRIIREEKVVKYEAGGEKMQSVAAQIKAVVYTAPDGTEYVEAQRFETAHLIVERPSGNQRLRRFEESLLARKAAKAEHEATARQKAKDEDAARQEKVFKKLTPKEKRHEEVKPPVKAQVKRKSTASIDGRKKALPRQGSRERYAALGREEEAQPKSHGKRSGKRRR